ncbi:hypothetical protein GCM10009609_47830 [Pseudonocardia aurantiaca]
MERSAYVSWCDDDRRVRLKESQLRLLALSHTLVTSVCLTHISFPSGQGADPRYDSPSDGPTVPKGALGINRHGAAAVGRGKDDHQFRCSQLLQQSSCRRMPYSFDLITL